MSAAVVAQGATAALIFFASGVREGRVESIMQCGAGHEMVHQAYAKWKAPCQEAATQQLNVAARGQAPQIIWLCGWHLADLAALGLLD